MNNILIEDKKAVAALWYAVLGQAIIDYNKNPDIYTRKQKISETNSNRLSAQWWLFKSKLKGVGTFDWICRNFRLNKEYIRKSTKTSHATEKD